MNSEYYNGIYSNSKVYIQVWTIEYKSISYNIYLFGSQYCSILVAAELITENFSSSLFFQYIDLYVDNIVFIIWILSPSEL